jgi:hypothetical protein
LSLPKTLLNGHWLPPLEADGDEKKAKLEKIISRWKALYYAEIYGCPDRLAYMLDYRYTDANL